MNKEQTCAVPLSSKSVMRCHLHAIIFCVAWILSLATAWSKDIQLYNHSSETIEAAIEFDYALIGPGQSATLTVSEGGYWLVFGPEGTGFPYNTSAEITHEDNKVLYFGMGDYPLMSEYHLANGKWVLDYTSVRKVEFHNHSQDDVELASEYDSGVVAPGDSITLTVSTDGYWLVFGPLGSGYPYNSNAELTHNATKISYFGADNGPRFSEYHYANGQWVLDYSSLWTIEFHNQSQDTVEAAIEYDFATIPSGQSAMLSVSGGGYWCVFGPIGSGLAYNTNDEITHEKKKIVYYGFDDVPLFDEYHWENGQWVLDNP